MHMRLLLLNFSLVIIRVFKARTMRCVVHAERMRLKRTAYGVLFGKPERKRLL